jgi:hypothetical protein
MSKEQLIQQITQLAAEENITFVEACQAMQAAAGLMNDEKMIMVIHRIKMASLGL